MDWKEKKFLVFGAGISGIAACELLLKQGIEVVLFDGKKSLDTTVIREKSPQLKEVPIYVGELPEEELKTIHIAV